MSATLLKAHRATSFCVIAALLACACGDRDSQASATDAGATAQTQRLIATSESHSCALRDAGLYCWGSNFAGQLGDIQTHDSLTPVRAHFAGTDIVQLALATGRTCVRRSTGVVSCWGTNDNGQFGDGTRADSYTPVDALGINDATQLAIDDDSTCVLRAGDAGVACWGKAPASTPTEGSVVPVPIAGLSPSIAELRGGALGMYCARELAGTVKCWKFDEGTWTTASEVPALAGARAIALTYASAVCALTAASDIKCFMFDGATTLTVADSFGSEALAPSGGLAVCGADAARSWRCWPILPSVDYTALRVHSSVLPVELVMMGLRICALREDVSVACLTSDDLTVVPTTDFPDLLPIDLPL